MGQVSREDVESVLAAFVDPYTEKDLVATKSVGDIQVDGGRVTVDIILGYPAKGYRSTLTQQLKERIEAIDGVTEAEPRVTWKIVPHQVQKGLKPISSVKNIIAVASGKGGVGKSTTAVNLALALSAEGASVGILDADIYGPSQPRMLGIKGRPDSRDGKSLEPMMAYRLQSMSIGYLIDEETPMVWRGPMVTQALEQLLNETQWKELDYLVVDLPPGTGDTQLTLAQKVPVSGAVIVTTPQEIALLDARKGLKMFDKVEVQVLGILENMSTHICSQCGHEEHIFGAGGGQRIAEENGTVLLGSLPLDLRIREETDSGHPTVVADPDCSISQSYYEVARRTAARLALSAREYSGRFPNIVVESS